ncbi:hypothetical protein [Longispora urticae]
MINYDGRRFRSAVVSPNGEQAVAQYRQDGDLLWAEFAGGEWRRGSINGVCAADGRLTFGYTMVRLDGEVISGRCVSTPQLLEDGRIRLHEEWERFGPHADRGVSYLEEVA